MHPYNFLFYVEEEVLLINKYGKYRNNYSLFGTNMYNINSPCEEGKKTLISWQFPGQSKQFNDQGDDYEIGLSFYDCPFDVNAYISFNINLMNGQLPYDQPYYDIYLEPNTPGLALSRLVELPDIDNLITPIYSYYGYISRFEKSYLGKRGQVGNNLGQKKAVIVPPKSGLSFDLPTLRNVQLVLPDRANSCKKYFVNIYKQGKKIFTDTGLERPVVTWECEDAKCPEGTCDVDCGNTICCYNSQGISIFNYPKS